MISPLIKDVKEIRKLLKKFSKNITFEELTKWQSMTWANMIAITAGLDPFTKPAISTIPPIFQVFLPKFEFKPNKTDRKYAYLTLKNAMVHVNKAIVEATKEIYKDLTQGGGNFFSGMIPAGMLPKVDMEEFSGLLAQQLEIYEQRKQFFQLGMSMMSQEEAWIGKHHLFALNVISLYEEAPHYKLTDSDYINIAEDLGILEDGAITYIPEIPKKT